MEAEVSHDTEHARRWEEWRINQEAAHRSHDKYHDDTLEMLRSTISFGLEAVRICALINGGAAVAGLTLVGAILKDNPQLARVLASGVTMFAFGTLLAGVGSGLGYLTQFFYSMYHQSSTLTFDHPYVKDDKSAAFYSRIGVAFHVLCVAAIAASYALLCWGAVRIAGAI